MPTQVRIFTKPQSLDETLAKPAKPTLAQPPYVPRSVPIYPEIPKPTIRCSTPRLPLPPAMSVYDEKRVEGGITFAHQDKLPKLPIPDLKSSAEKYLVALKPLQTAREHAETKHAVDEFLRHDGPELQEKLKRYAEGRTSYIEQFCKS